MQHRFTSTFSRLLGILTLVASAAPLAAANPNPRIDILVNGAVRPRYGANGTCYIEAVKGREYEIRLTNPYPVRVAVALSVDGLNTIDARHTTAATARKWVLDPYETITIGGWQTSMNQARRFEFTSEEKSYGSMLGQTADLGIISAVFYRERAARVVPIQATQLPVPPDPPGAGDAGRNRAEASSWSGAASAPAPAQQVDEYAATGIGRTTDHAVRMVTVDLEDTPAASISIRYEYRAQLVRLGVLPPAPSPDDPLARREQARGFVGGFCPDPKRDQ